MWKAGILFARQPSSLNQRACVSASRYGWVQHQKHVPQRDVHQWRWELQVYLQTWVPAGIRRALLQRCVLENPHVWSLPPFFFSLHLSWRVFFPCRLPRVLILKPDWYSFLCSVIQTAMVSETRLVLFQRGHLGSFQRSLESAEVERF